MKKEYNFSKGERGKFYNKKVKLNIPVYLDSKTFSFVKGIAEKKKKDISTVVNDLLKTEMKIIKYIK